MTDHPTDAEIQKVREWECRSGGHSWSVVMSASGPASIRCDHCGDRHGVIRGSIEPTSSEWNATPPTDANHPGVAWAVSIYMDHHYVSTATFFDAGEADAFHAHMNAEPPPA